MICYLTILFIALVFMFLLGAEKECDKEQLGYTCHHRKGECNKSKGGK